MHSLLHQSLAIEMQRDRLASGAARPGRKRRALQWRRSREARPVTEAPATQPVPVVAPARF
jgi:hypothetical protein